MHGKLLCIERERESQPSGVGWKQCLQNSWVDLTATLAVCALMDVWLLGWETTDFCFALRAHRATFTSSWDGNFEDVFLEQDHSLI